MYYRIIDQKDYLHSGYNATSKREVKEAIWEWLGPDAEEVYETDTPYGIRMDTMLTVHGLNVETSDTPFEEVGY